MNHSTHLEKIKTFLDQNSFYDYQQRLTDLFQAYLHDYLETTNPANKRNLVFHKSWSELDTFGKKRQVIVMELGGSYFKLFKAKVINKKKVVILKNQSYQFYEDKVYTPEILFTDIKKQLDAFIGDEDKSEVKNVVFIFAFPIEQYKRADNYIDAICVNINKNHRSERIIGMKIGESLQDFLRSRGYPHITISVTNDTPASLLASKAIEITHNQHFDAVINIIVGTGSNIAVGYDVVDNGKPAFKIINTEFGNFTSAPLSKFDHLLNDSLESKNQYLTEKMISGAWTHLLFKIIVREAIQNKLLDQSEIDQYYLNDMDSGEIESFLKNSPKESFNIMALQFIWSEIIKRGATICGITLAAIMSDLHTRLSLSKLDIGIIQVGSVIEKAYHFKKILLEVTDSQLARLHIDGKVQYHFFNPSFQTVLGATIFDSFFTQSDAC